MASTAAESTSICPVCRDTRPLKIAGRCKHSVCTECLSTAIGGADGDVFPCPTCQADCPRPWNGVEGLVDFTGEEIAVEDLGPLVMEKKNDRESDVVGTDPKENRGEKGEKVHHAEIVLDVRCKICHHQKKQVQAVNLCVECDHLHICKDCTDVHARNQATQGHAVIRLWSEGTKKQAMCQKHDSALDSYCHVCKQAVCVVCVMLEHGDHTIEKLGELVEAKVETLEVIFEEKQTRLEKLQKLEEQLILLTKIAPVVDKQDVLIKEIEDHAQECIDKIIKWKEDLKGQVKADYRIIHDIPECLKEVSEGIRRLQDPIKKAGVLLTEVETEDQPMYLEKLMALQQDFEALTDTGDEQGEGYTDQLYVLHSNECSFTPAVMNSLGAIKKAPAKHNEFKPKEIFKLTMEVDSRDKFIPCVANLGQKFAVAHPTQDGKPSRAIDIYEFPGNLEGTLKDHVPPLYDMSATPDGKLAVLSDGTGGTSRCVKLFDSETGYISSTRDFDVPKPLSLGVTLQHQYVILGDNEQGERQITVVDKDGSVEHTHVIKEEIDEKRINPSRITCGGRFIFVIGKLGAFAYEIKDTEMDSIGMCSRAGEPDNTNGIDISANVWDNIVVTYLFGEKRFSLAKCVQNEEIKSKWIVLMDNILRREVTQSDRETRVSTRGSYIVTSHGQTIRIFKE